MSEAPTPHQSESSAAPATTQARPTDITIVAILAVLAGLGDIVAGATYVLTADDTASASSTFVGITTILVGLLTVLIAVLLFRGMNAARVVLGVVMLAHIAVHITAWLTLGSSAAATSLISIFFSAVILIMLFSRESKAFVNR